MAAPKSASQDVAEYLATQGLGTLAASSGWAIFTSHMPASPDSCIVTYEFGGLDPDPKWLIDFLTVQVRVRGDVGDYTNAWAKAQSVKDTLLGLGSTTINGSSYIGITMLSDLIFVAYDDNQRPIITGNFRVIREPSDATNRQSL